MSKSRREFLAHTSLAVLGAAVAVQGQQPAEPTPGAPPAFGTAPPVGPEVSPETFVEAEKLVEIELTKEQLAEAAGNWRSAMAPLYERRVGPRKTELEASLAPATRWNPMLPGVKSGPSSDEFVRSKADAGPLPQSDEDIAFAPVWKLSRWIEQRKLTSERLTQLYLARLEKFNPKLRCVITLTTELAHAAGEATPIAKLRRENIVGRCTAFRGARKIFSIPMGLRRPTVRSRFAIECRRQTRWL